MIDKRGKFGDGIDWGAEADRALQDGINPAGLSNPDLDIIKRYKDGGRLADCGCNIGRYAEVYARSGFTYVGIDQSEHAIEIAKKYHPKEEFCVMFLWDLQYKDAFDVVVCNAVLQHNTLEEKKRIIEKIYAALKKGGVFFYNESTVLSATETQLTHEGWIGLTEGFGFSLLESWHENPLGLQDCYIFEKK